MAGRSVALLFALALVRSASATEAQQVSPSGEEVQVFDVREFTTGADARVRHLQCASWRAAIHPSQPATAVCGGVQRTAASRRSSTGRTVCTMMYAVVSW